MDAEAIETLSDDTRNVGRPELFDLEPVVEPTVVEPVLTGDDRDMLRAAALHLAEAVEAWIDADGIGDGDGVTAAKEHVANAVSVIEGAGSGGEANGETGELAVTALVPDTAVIGTPSFTLSVQGTGFDAESVILFNGYPEPTTLVSPTEVTTGVNMDVWSAPSAPLPVGVRSGTGELSNTRTFTFVEAGAGTASRSRRSR